MDHSQMTGPENVIDGAKHPEKIADVDAWRIFLLAAANEWFDELRYSFHAKLTDDLAAQIQQVIVDFNQRYTAANDQYNVSENSDSATGQNHSQNIRTLLQTEKALTRAAQSQNRGPSRS
jgi:hypothetical protein